MTCTDISKFKFYFNDLIEVDKIINSRWFNNFTNIQVATEINKLPESISHLTLGSQYRTSIKGFIPKTIKTITFCWDGNLNFFHKTLLETYIDIYLAGTSIDDFFPQSVTEIIINGTYAEQHREDLCAIICRKNLKIRFKNPFHNITI